MLGRACDLVPGGFDKTEPNHIVSSEVWIRSRVCSGFGRCVLRFVGSASSRPCGSRLP